MVARQCLICSVLCNRECYSSILVLTFTSTVFLKVSSCFPSLCYMRNFVYSSISINALLTSTWCYKLAKCFLQTCSFLLHKTLIDGLEWCGLFVDYCDVFISCLDSHSDGTHSLQRICWWASDVRLNFFRYVLVMKQTHLHLVCPEGKFLAHFHFWVKYG